MSPFSSSSTLIQSLALETNNTWTLTSLPSGKKPIGCKWVFKNKFHANGSIEHHKAQLIAKGYTQVEGFDYYDTFALVAKLIIVRCVLAIVAARHWHLHQLDVNNAFLHGDLDEEVYMTLPLGYGQKWESRDSRFLIHCSLVYVDDIIITGNDLTVITNLKNFLADRFKLKDLRILKYFLGLEVARSPFGIFLSQPKYVLGILADFGTLGSRPTSFPMEQDLKLTSEDGVLLSDPNPYRILVGRLIYLTITRLDISFYINILSQFMQAP
ncbi:Retrovirus-related Pol polyprotein from transposon RE1 [Vitis vinifera]|uniref:Retrovirus-related Pol polyprotein from transposon RE1 n=1 Tax=Vitis vinifera TaxID=29760 RepID=A0A438DXH6_VITVI|nr:Retrovirus-related Pol polyprotein from transposon RE1 [Vitis vinifera]